MSAAPRPEALQRPAFQGRTWRGGAEWALPGGEAGLRGGRVPKGRDRGGGSPTTIHSPARGRPRGRPALSSTNEALYLQGVHPSLARQKTQIAAGGRGGPRKRRGRPGAASPEWARPGQEQRHKALGTRTQGRGRPAWRRRHTVSSLGSGRGPHHCSSAHRMAGPLRREREGGPHWACGAPCPRPQLPTHHRGGPTSCIPGVGSRYWWWAQALQNPLQSRARWHL